MGSTIVDKSGHLNPLTEPTQEDLFWLSADPDHLWVMDKLILARKLGAKELAKRIRMHRKKVNNAMTVAGC